MYTCINKVYVKNTYNQRKEKELFIFYVFIL